jgi:hypothetical protein
MQHFTHQMVVVVHGWLEAFPTARLAHLVGVHICGAQDVRHSRLIFALVTGRPGVRGCGTLRQTCKSCVFFESGSIKC